MYCRYNWENNVIHHLSGLVNTQLEQRPHLISLVLFIRNFGQVNSYFCLSCNIIQLHFGLVGPILRAVCVTLLNFEFIPSLSILLPGTIHLVWLDFVQQKHRLYSYQNIEIQLVRVFNSVLPNLFQSLQEILLRRFTKFSKGSCHTVYGCVCNS